MAKVKGETTNVDKTFPVLVESETRSSLGTAETAETEFFQKQQQPVSKTKKISGNKVKDTAAASNSPREHENGVTEQPCGQEQVPFFRLSPELRNAIYDLVFQDLRPKSGAQGVCVWRYHDARYQGKNTDALKRARKHDKYAPPGLLRVCRSIFVEVLPMYLINTKTIWIIKVSGGNEQRGVIRPMFWNSALTWISKWSRDRDLRELKMAGSIQFHVSIAGNTWFTDKRDPLAPHQESACRLCEVRVSTDGRNGGKLVCKYTIRSTVINLESSCPLRDKIEAFNERHYHQLGSPRVAISLYDVLEWEKTVKEWIQDSLFYAVDVVDVI